MPKIQLFTNVQDESDDEITLDDIISEKMSPKILRDFLRYTIEGIKNEDDLIFE